MKEFIELTSVTTHNLKGINVRFPLGDYSVVTGVSGSGKSSLVFDTLYGEAYRRYVESLSSFARQYLKAMPKPGVREVSNLPPAIAVQQNRAGLNSRSTVGTLTETIDIMRILYTHAADVVCPGCGDVVRQDTQESITRLLLGEAAGRRVMILADLSFWEKMKAKELKTQLEIQGFARLFKEGRVVRLDEAKAADLKGAWVITDRLEIAPGDVGRLADSIDVALKAGRGRMGVAFDDGALKAFSSDLTCMSCSKTFAELSTPAMLNFNHPLAACPTCQGFGRESVPDREKIIPDMEESLQAKGVACWNFGKHVAYYGWAKKSAQANGFDFAKSFKQYTAQEWAWLFEGSKVDSFNGISGYFDYLESKKYKTHYRIHAARFQTYVPCSGCGGERLKPEALVYRLGGLDIAALARLPVKDLRDWLADMRATFTRLGLTAGEGSDDDTVMGLKEALEEAEARLDYMLKMGLGYLSLGRSARTLSGGELQRINMARSLGSALTGTLFCLDEPSVGLHARDSANLLSVIRELKDQGNTVVVVEHDQKIIEAADYLIEIGPEAGHKGGEVVYAGDAARKERALSWDFGATLAADFDRFIALEKAATHNLKDVTARFPVGHLTAVCGVSGSGKTSLIQHTLYPLLLRALGRKASDIESEPMAKGVGPAKVIQAHREVVMVSQRGIGRSSRSNIATYLGIFNDVRNIFAALPQAKSSRLTPSHFSFNVPGGRCENCKGLGTVVEDLSFLGEMAILCPVCNGRRFSDAVLDVRYRGKTLIDVLQLTVAQARELFYDQPSMARALDAIIDLGLGYITLGQSTSSFSGGEAQRLKLLDLIKEKQSAKPCLLIFDEPSTGLSDRDVHSLMLQFKKLTARGHTLIVIEHHLGVLRAADWLIEIGPESADAGGRLMYEGPPAGLKNVKDSITARFL